ncbi:motile sperm domain-containing protein 2-like isoform X3 [Varroa jacobsoni]|uniref:Uncharacterized protein n=1 Tax=Varroa destructor TaxID=109461 RepID=A0A7M7IXF8_VARDE|nr:motile sperm domain-containing protein 2-like isoform X3 [Varroa destructor]XP_022701266.1 motile sperm domain-containing protein 2-like isoform X3 [Varroa jacobsoni]
MSGKIGKTKSKEKKCKVILRTSLDKQDIRRFQQLLRNTISASSELYDPKDVDVLVEDEVICEKFLRRSEACVENALDYAIQSFRWRKTFGVSAIDASGVSQLALDSGVMYFHGFSIGDAFILIFRADLILEPFDSQEETLCHRYLVMFLEEAVIRRKGNVTLLFDCTKARKENLRAGKLSAVWYQQTALIESSLSTKSRLGNTLTKTTYHVQWEDKATMSTNMTKTHPRCLDG